jgi:sulfite exporter TauE/SafE
MIAFWTGLVAGIVHVWSGPDHLAAIAPLAVRRPKQTWIPGAKWGLGHSSGVAVVGVLSLLLRDVIPTKLISNWGERLVGVMLVAIGIWALRKAFRVHAHEHEHDGDRHVHLHSHVHRAAHDRPEAHAYHTHAAMGIGILHGLAGSSHFLAVLPLLALPTHSQAIAYMLAFAIGTIVSMASFSTVMGFLAQRFARSSVQIYRGLMCVCSVAALAVGTFWLVTAQ